MARVAEKQLARALRAEGKTYSEIKQVIGVGKGTLSEWLADMPLSSEQLRRVRDLNPLRIERRRATMLRKREAKLAKAYGDAKRDIGKLTKREIFVAGLYLYWAEGLKTYRGTVGVANTDPAMLRMFLRWAQRIGLSKERARIRLHLYRDMDESAEVRFWMGELGLERVQFRKLYIKDSTLTGLTYKNGHGHGTCNILFDDMAKWEYITMVLKRLREIHKRP